MPAVGLLPRQSHNVSLSGWESLVSGTQQRLLDFFSFHITTLGTFVILSFTSFKDVKNVHFLLRLIHLVRFLITDWSN